MGKELSYIDFYKKYKKLTVKEIQALIDDTSLQIRAFERPTSEGFIILNESSNNLKHAVLIQLLEEKQKDTNS